MDRSMDRLKIISMNAAGRNGVKAVQRSYLEEILGRSQPDLLLLPGDSPDMQKSVVLSYKQFMVPHNKHTVLIYDPNRLDVKRSPWELWIPGIDKEKVVFPTVDVLCPQQKEPVKTFQRITWHWELSVTAPSNHRATYAKEFMMLANLLVSINGTEVLIGGDFNLPIPKIKQLIAEHNKLIENGIESLKPAFRKMGYMDCMTESIIRPGKRLSQLKLHECKNLPHSQENPNYFISSREMQLFETTTLNVESVSGKMATIKANTPEPAQTQMCVPARPPRHVGG